MLVYFFNWGFSFFVSIYTIFRTDAAILSFFCHFSYNISFLYKTLIFLDAHYFDSESSKMHKITFKKKKTDGDHFVFVFHENCVKFRSTHNIQAYL